MIITKNKHFRMSTGRFSANTAWNGTSGLCGNDATPLGLGMGVGDIPPQGSGVAATPGYGTESRWDSGHGQATRRRRPHRPACEERKTAMNAPVKWLAAFWKLEKETEKMLEGLATT